MMMNEADKSEAQGVSAREQPLGHQYLCYAWGETDLPEAFIATGRGAVREFILHVWYGGTECEGVDEAMAEFEAHDFAEDGMLEWGFEQGAVRIERVFERGEWQTTMPDIKALDMAAYGLAAHANALAEAVCNSELNRHGVRQ